jgi:dUTP pyrophosphatase
MPAISFTKTQTNAKLPIYMTREAAGADLFSANSTPITIAPGAHMLIGTGLIANIPDGYEIQIRSKSGLALRHKLAVLNSPGTIDSDYKDEIGVILINHNSSSYVVHPGSAIAQMVVAPVTRLRLQHNEQEYDYEATTNRSGGFGSTTC